jgi:hypothetical protein
VVALAARLFLGSVSAAARGTEAVQRASQLMNSLRSPSRWVGASLP